LLRAVKRLPLYPAYVFWQPLTTGNVVGSHGWGLGERTVNWVLMAPDPP